MWYLSAFYKQLTPSLVELCNLFSCRSKPIHALLACKRCPLSLLLTPFWSPIKHLLICYFITNWFPFDYKPASYMCFYRYLLTCYLNLCNDFSKRYQWIFEVLDEIVLNVREWWEDRYSTVLAMFLFNE